MTTWQLRDPRMAEAIQVAREYLGPEAEYWPDDEVVHQLTIKAIDLQRQLNEFRPKEPAGEAPKWRYGGTRDTDAWHPRPGVWSLSRLPSWSILDRFG